MSDISNGDGIDIDDLLAMNDDDLPTPASTPEPTPAVEPAQAPVEEAPREPVVKKTRAPRKPKATEAAAPAVTDFSGGGVIETAEQKRIRELEAELETAGELAPAEGPTPEQIRIAELERQIKAKKEAAIENAAPVYEQPTGKGELIELHFIADGLIVQGEVTYRGQEMVFEVGSQAYEQTKDRNGHSWLDLIDDIDGQFDRWKQQYIARGPWRGRKWGDTTTLTDPQDIADAQAAAKAEARRGKAAPVIVL